MFVRHCVSGAAGRLFLRPCSHSLNLHLSNIPTTTTASTSSPTMFSRSFFSLPDVSSLSPFANNKAEAPPPGPKTYHERKILPFVVSSSFIHEVVLMMSRYTRKQLYAIVEDIESYHNYVPFCTESRITSPPTPSSKGNGQTELEAELKVGFMSISEAYTSRVTCTPFESVEVSTFFFSVPLLSRN